MRWDMVGVLPKTDQDYKPRLTIGSKDYNDMPLIRRVYIDEEKQKENAINETKQLVFKSSPDIEFNGLGCFSFLGNLGKWDLRADNYPGINFSVTPYIELSRGIFELDVNFSWGVNRKNDGKGGSFRDNIKQNGRLSRTKLGEFDTQQRGKWNVGVDPLQHGKTSTVNKDQWFLSEMDDIFKVEFNKLGGGFTVDAHIGFGVKMYNNIFSNENAKREVYLKALEVRGGFGWFASGYWKDLKEHWKYFSINAFYNFVAQANIGLGLRSWNYKHSNGSSERIHGFFFEGLGEVKGGFGISLGSDFEKNSQGGNNQGGNEGANEGGNEN